MNGVLGGISVNPLRLTEEEKGLARLNTTDQLSVTFPLEKSNQNMLQNSEQEILR